MQFRPSRRSVLKWVGALGAASVARFGGFVPELQAFSSAPGKPVRPLTGAWQGLRLSDAAEVDGAELESVNSSILGRSDVTEIANAHGLNLPRTSKVVAHRVEGGGRLLAAAWELPSNQVLLFWSLDQPVDGIATQARLFRVDDWQATVVAFSINGGLAQAERVSAQAEPPGVIQASADSCGGCGCWGFCGSHTVTNCCSYDLRCLANCCGPCVFGCNNFYACLGCFGIWCPLCVYWVSNCCTAWCNSCASCFHNPPHL